MSEERERAKKRVIETFQVEYDSTVGGGITLYYRGEKVKEFKKGEL